MPSLRYWSFARVFFVSAGWVLLCLVVATGWLYFQFRRQSAEAGSGGIGFVGEIGFVSFSVVPLMLAIPLGPPIVLFLTWLVMRRPE